MGGGRGWGGWLAMDYYPPIPECTSEPPESTCPKMSKSKSESKSELYDLAVDEYIVTAGEPEMKKPIQSRRAALFLRYVQPCLAELLGSTLFIFIGCLSVVENVSSTGRLQPALAHGLALGIVIAVLGEIRYEPAVGNVRNRGGGDISKALGVQTSCKA